MAGYDDTYQMIINTLIGRPSGHEIQPEDHQAFALSMLEYIRSLELLANAPFIGLAKPTTQPIQPNDSRACYIAGVGQERTTTFQNFYDIDGNPISITNGEMEACLVIFVWNGQYWSAESVPTNIINYSEQSNLYYIVTIRKTYGSISEMNEDSNYPIGDDGRYIKVGELVSVVNSSNSEENSIYIRTSDGWKFQSSWNFSLSQDTGDDVNSAMSQYAVTKIVNEIKQNLVNLANKDLSNVTSDTIRDKAGVYEVLSLKYDIDENHSVSFSEGEDAGNIIGSVAEDQSNTLYFTSTSSIYGSGISPVSVKISYPYQNQTSKINYIANFIGVDNFIHRLILDEEGNISRQYSYSLDDFATKQDIEDIQLGDLTSQGYKPIHIIDLGTYDNGVFSLDGTPYWGDMQTTLYSYLDGGCGVLLRARTQFDEPRVFAPTRIYRDGDTLYVMEFMVSATQLCEIRIDEDADVESGESLFSQTLINIGGGGSGSGTVTTSQYSDIDYKEI